MSKLLKLGREPLIIPSLALSRKAALGSELVDLRALGIWPEISGGSETRGFSQVGDVVTLTADGRPLNDLWNEYQAVLQSYNAARDPLMGLLTFNVTTPIEDVLQGGSTVNFEEASEFGVPVGVRAEPPTFFSMGYTFRWYDVAARFTWMYLAEATSQQTDAIHNQILEADNRLMFVEVMKALFNKTGRHATIKQQNYNVYPLYNADGTVPPTYKTNTFVGSHTHYLTSGAGTVDSGDLDDMETHLAHHGYTWMNGTALILVVNTAELNTIKTFRFADGDSYDFIPAAGAPAWAIPPDLMIQPGSTPPSVFQGMPVSGRYGPWLIVNDDQTPAGYMIGLASGGPLSASNPVGIREHANTGLRGLRLVKGPNPDYPLIDSYYQRGFGTGIRQRGGSVIMQIKSGSYDIPAAYL